VYRPPNQFSSSGLTDRSGPAPPWWFSYTLRTSLIGGIPGGALVVGFIDRDGPLGRQYEERKEESVFYASARFHRASEVARLLEDAGFEELKARQTLFSDPETMTEPDPVEKGVGEGGFAVIRGVKPA